MAKKHWEYDSVKKYVNEYQKQNIKTVPFRLNINTEADILEWLDQQPNKRQYIISLIREDISKKQGKD